MKIMKITVVAIGKKHSAQLGAAIEEYSKRLGHYTDFEWKLCEAKITNSMSERQIRAVESEVIANQLSSQDIVVLLDERGSEISSPQLAQKLESYHTASVKRLVFVIGGAYGVTGDFQKRAHFTWSLSPLVFPHQIVRLLLVEQLYRAHTILAGEHYHHQ